MFSFILRWVGICCVALVVLIGFVPAWQRKLAQRNWIADQYRFGDMYNTTNVVRFKEQDFKATDKLDSADLPKTKQAGVHLYTIGDSFTDIDTAYYAAEKNVHVWIGTETKQVHLDTTKRNILVIQIIERVLQERFRDDSYLLYTTRALVDSSCAEPPAETRSNWISDLVGTRFGTDLNSRLEFMLFNNKYALRAKEWKASLLLDWFDRAAGARLSPNKQHVFYLSETDTTSQLSAFRHLAQTDIDSVVNHLNAVTAYYRELGFDEVYLTLIPNKSTVLAPNLGAYNRQIERIERHPNLQPKVISTLETMRRHPDWYHRGDGHWNQQGRRYWLNLVNGLVRASPHLMARTERLAGLDSETYTLPPASAYRR